jgi:hypothetical protein
MKKSVVALLLALVALPVMAQTGPQQKRNTFGVSLTIVRADTPDAPPVPATTGTNLAGVGGEVEVTKVPVVELDEASAFAATAAPKQEKPLASNTVLTNLQPGDNILDFPGHPGAPTQPLPAH